VEVFKIFINFKTYPQGTGEKAVELAKICEGFGGDGKFEIIPVVQAADLYRIKQSVKIPVWVQHTDWQKQGQHTGWQNLEAVVEAGASGTLLNHSEHPLSPGTIKQVLARVKEAKRQKNKDFEVMVCCKTLGQMERLAKLKPGYLGYEIEELIGKEVSIVDFDIKALEHAKEICKEIPLIIGAGVHKPGDLKKAKELGCGGVLISSAIVLAENPKEKLAEIVNF